MMIFILVSGLLVQSMKDDAFDTRNFLNSSLKLPLIIDEDDEKKEENLKEIYLFIMILCYIAFSSLGVMILPWTLISELFPIEVIKDLII